MWSIADLRSAATSMIEGTEDEHNAAERYRFEAKVVELDIDVRAAGSRTEMLPAGKPRSAVGCCGSMCTGIHASIREPRGGGGHVSA